MNLSRSRLIELANRSLEKAEIYFNNEEYQKCANETAKAKTYLLRNGNPLLEPRGRDIIIDCGLSLNEFETFDAYLPYATLLEFEVQTTQKHSQVDIDKEKAEFLLRFVKELLLKVQELE